MMEKSEDKLKEIEEWICDNTQEEGFGSVYERISLGRFLNRIKNQFKFKTVLEYGAPYSKGYDNMVFLKNKCEVTIADPKIEKIKKNWPSKTKPLFTNMDLKNTQDKKYDLVWNFAYINTNPEVIEKMKEKSKKYVLFFTPNIWNYGTPFHIVYHIISRTKCTHAERGPIEYRKISGLKKFAKKNGLKIIETGYVDMPWWPDTAFGIREFKENVLKKKLPPPEKKDSQPGKQVLEKVNAHMFVENSKLGTIRYLFAHHQYILAEKI